ncbi:flagellin [Bradyrhizobium sp. UFLA 03-164]|uniref:Flagellin n=1 Tax=Bradyrhizobium uaiense TaxID=2594946 RepID=A0A6P1BQA7_9BRAD|nr:flagellin [Bradyrhizobium uaiense]NEV00566.1 flagellin [Bradyrhizobium uaiense]
MPAISTNTAANSAVHYLNINSQQETSALSKLSSGSRITSASDDAAGLAISTRISSDITTLQQAATNAAQATSILQTADGASNISDILARMKSLASESASGTVADSSRAYINSEFTQLKDEIDSIGSGTRYSSQSLLDGSRVFSSGVSVLVGSTSADTITITLTSLTASSLGVTSLDVSSLSSATNAMSALDSGIDTVSSARVEIGARNRASTSAPTRSQNLQSRLRSRGAGRLMRQQEHPADVP